MEIKSRQGCREEGVEGFRQVESPRSELVIPSQLRTIEQAREFALREKCRDGRLNQGGIGLTVPATYRAWFKQAATKTSVLSVEALEGFCPKGNSALFPFFLFVCSPVFCVRVGIQFASKETCKRMSSPCMSDWAKVRQLERYLRKSRQVLWLALQDAQSNLHVYVDTDYAGCPRTRRSTHGGLAIHGSHLLKTWATARTVVAPSSGEASGGQGKSDQAAEYAVFLNSPRPAANKGFFRSHCEHMNACQEARGDSERGRAKRG